MAKRVESPSSINTFLQCKRKYYYQYIEKHSVPSTIHTLRGQIVHTVLDKFYSVSIISFTNATYPQQLRVELQDIFIKEWGAQREALLKLHLPREKLITIFDETLLMLFNWYEHFLCELKVKVQKTGDVQLAFAALIPQREIELTSASYSVHGFADAIYSVNDAVHILDYKTNAQTEIKDSILLQLAIYSLIYEEMYGKRPDKVGAFFLRDTVKMLDVDEHLITLAKQEIKKIHEHTSTAEHIDAYPRTVTPLCKWRDGQCAFYDFCKPHAH